MDEEQSNKKIDINSSLTGDKVEEVPLPLNNPQYEYSKEPIKR